jgi:hypothetical protein
MKNIHYNNVICLEKTETMLGGCADVSHYLMIHEHYYVSISNAETPSVIRTNLNWCFLTEIRTKTPAKFEGSVRGSRSRGGGGEGLGAARL